MISAHNYIFYIVSLITILVYLLAFKYILDKLSSKKLSNRINYTIIIFTSIIIFIFKFERSITFIFICSAFYKINYKQNVFKCTKFSLIYWFCVYIPIEYISLELAFHINYNRLTQNFHVNSMKIEIESMLIQIILMLVVTYILTHIKSFYKLKKIKYIFICIPILINIITIILTFRLIAIDKSLVKYHILLMVLFPILVIFSKIYIFNIVKKNIENYKLEYENKIIKDNVLKEYNYYLEVSKEKNNVKSLYHDIKNHMICIRSLCEKNNIEKIIEYIDSMENNVNTYNQLNQEFNTGNMILDSILKNKKTICIEKDIKFVSEIDFSKNDFMDMVDVCTIFSNLIDNAIEACEKINESNIDKRILLKSKYIDGFCIVLIENTKTNEIKQRKNLFLTHKEDPYMHGIGLSNVKKTVEKYFGEAIFNYSKNIFSVKIMIPLEKSSTN